MFPLDLTESNVNNFLSGKPVQLKKEQLHGNKHYLIVHPETHKRLVHAKSKGKGLRITMTPQELAASGEGFRDILSKIKKGAQWLKTHVIDSNIYQQDVKPIVRKLVDAGVSAASPMLPAPVASLAKQGIDKLGEVTNAFGLEASKSKKPKSKPGGRGSTPLDFKGVKPKAKPKASKKPKTITMDEGGSFYIN
jgi:hypothetical protein